MIATLRFVRRRSLAASALVGLAALQIGCTSSSTVTLAAPSLDLVSHAGVIELRDDRGHRTPVAPDSRVHFIRRDGGTTSWVRAGDLCRTTLGLEVRNPIITGCFEATPFVRFDEIESVAVENWDRAGTTAIIAGAAVVVVGVIVVAVAALGRKKEKTDDDEAPSRSSGSSSSQGSSHGPNLIAPALRVGAAMAEQAEYDDAVARPLHGPGPLFDPADRRRRTVQVLLDTDLSASALAPRDSLATGGRVGARLWSFFDVSLGVRALEGEDRPTRPVPVLGLGFHGPLPRAPWFAIAVGGEVGATSAIGFYGTGRLGVRLSPFTRFWVTLYPLHPTYTSWSGGRGDRWVAASTLEMSYAF